MASYKMQSHDYDKMVKNTSFLVTAVQRFINSLSSPTSENQQNNNNNVNSSNLHILRYLSTDVKCELVHQLCLYISEMLFLWIAGKLFNENNRNDSNNDGKSITNSGRRSNNNSSSSSSSSSNSANRGDAFDNMNAKEAMGVCIDHIDHESSDCILATNLKRVAFSELGAMYFKREVDAIIKLFDDLYVEIDDEFEDPNAFIPLGGGGLSGSSLAIRFLGGGGGGVGHPYRSGSNNSNSNNNNTTSNNNNNSSSSSSSSSGGSSISSSSSGGYLRIPISAAHTSPRESFSKLTNICSLLTMDSLLELPEVGVDYSLFKDKEQDIKSILLSRSEFPKDTIRRMKI